MKRTLVWMASAVLCTAGLSQAKTAANDALKTNAPQTQVVKDGRARLEDIEARAANAATQADLIQHESQDLRASRELHIQLINQLKDDFNNIGKQIKSLEAEQGSLAPWEREALVVALPKLEEAAALTDQAILMFNQGGPVLFPNGNYATTAHQIYNNCREVANHLRTQRALAEATRKERELRHKVAGQWNS